jgi:hypothetical protein
MQKGGKGKMGGVQVRWVLLVVLGKFFFFRRNWGEE